MGTKRIAVTGACAALLAGLAACGDSGVDSPDFATADLKHLSFAPADVPAMEYQPDRSGAGAFTKVRENRPVAARLKKLGLESNYVSQFFATSRDSKVTFVESLVLLFEDQDAAEAAVSQLEREDLNNLDASKTIASPDVGEQAFGVRGEFDGYPVHSYGWRNGDALLLVTVAQNGENPGPGSPLRLAAQLDAKGKRRIARQEYIARSGAICQSTAKKAEVEFKRIVGVEGPPAPGQERRFLAKAQRFLVEAAIPIIRENVDRRRALRVPTGDEAEVKAIITAGEKALQGFREVASDQAKTRALFEGKLADPAKEFDALSRRYGIDKCGGDQ